MEHKNHTLFGGKTVEFKFEDGSSENREIRQFRLAEYRVAMRFIDDEFALLAHACGLPPQKVLTMLPDSFEAAYQALKEVNAKGFFTFADRQQERNAAALKNLPEEMLERLIKEKATTSSMPSRTGPPPAA